MRRGGIGVATAIGVAAMWLSACITPVLDMPPSPAPIEITVNEERLASSDIEALLGYTENVRRLALPQLQLEYARIERGQANKANAADRLKLAILLSLQHAPFRDEARARGLFLQAIGDSSYNSSAYRQLATLLLIGLDERRELERALEEERRQRQALGKKLDQLKVIEEEIDRRRAPPVMTPRNGSPRTDSGS